MILPMSTLSQVIPAVVSIVYICFVIFGFLQYKKVEFFWSFQLYMIMLAVWSLGSFMMRTGIDLFSPLVWNRIMLIGMLSAPFGMVHAITDTLGVKNIVIRRISRAAYLFIIPQMYMNFTGMVVEYASYAENIFYYRLGSGAIGAYLISYLYLALMFTLIMVEIRTGSYDSRTKSLFTVYLIGMLIMLGGILLNLYKPVGQYPVDILASMVNAIVLFYGIYRFRLINFTRLGLNALSMILLFVLASFLFFIVIFIGRGVSESFEPVNAKLLALTLGGVTLFVVYPLRYGAAYLVDQVIIPRRHPYQQMIKRFTQKLNTIVDLYVLGDEVIKSITYGVRINWAVCIVKNPKEYEKSGNYMLLSRYGTEVDLKTGTPVPLDLDQALSGKLDDIIEGKIPLVVTAVSQYGSFHFSKFFPPANMMIPLIFNKETNGFIFLSAPFDSRIFSPYELEELEVLARQCALSLKNSYSFEKIKDQRKQLEISNKKLESIFNGTGAPMALTDIDFSIIEVNYAATVLIGKKREDIIGEKCYKLFFQQHRACSFCKAPESIRSGHMAGSEVESPKGTFSLQFHPVNITHNSRQVFLEMIQDITDRKKMVDELIVSSKLADIGSLATGIAHDLNNPLAGITGTTELLLSSDVKEHERTEYLRDILQYTNNASEVLKDISSYAKKETQEAEVIDVIDALEFSLKLAARGSDMDQIAVTRDYQNTSKVLIKASDLQQVFLNLIINAVQAMDGTGTLGLQVFEQFGVVNILITDTGHGISREHIGQVFTPFFTTKEPGKGTGLGLSNCFRIVEKYSGRISVDSEEGKGSAFSLLFPSATGDSQQLYFVLAKKQLHFSDVFFLQRKVLIGEKGYIEETIYREIDDQAIHLVAYQGVHPVGTVSLIMAKDAGVLPVSSYFDIASFLKTPEESAEIIRLAVLPEKRHTIVTLGLVSLIFLLGRSKGMKEAVIDVFAEDLHYIEMYKKFGFEKIGTYCSPSEVTVLILQDRTVQEKDRSKRSSFIAPLFRKLIHMLDMGSEKEAIVREMKRIIPKLGIEQYDALP